MRYLKTRTPSRAKRGKIKLTFFLGGAALLALAGFAIAEVVIPRALTLSYGEEWIATTTPASPHTEERPTATHSAAPSAVKGIYMSQCVAGTPSFRDSLASLIKDTELNSVIIDIKDYTGKIAFATDNPALKNSVSDACGARDMREFIERLHDEDIYVIGRITVFQDPFYTKNHPEQSVQSKSRPGEPWKDYKGLSFVSVMSQPFWKYIVALSKESYALGFDELNYDYVRWPSDGPMSDIVYPSGHRAEALERFFEYLASEVKPTGAVLSVDLFGMTTTNFDDLNIGQVLERALPYFDYVAPMVYPSHYPKSFLGLGNPNSDPYKVVNYSMSEAVKRASATTTTVDALTHTLLSTSTKPFLYSKTAYSPLKLRPWLQDFDYGKDYLPADIEAQIKATYDAGLTSWMFWDPGNKYANLKTYLLSLAEASHPEN